VGASAKRSTKKVEDEDNDSNCILCFAETEDRGLVTQYPRKAAKKPPRDEECAVSIVERVRTDSKTSEFLLVKRADKGLLAGMWEFPTVEQERLQADHNQTSSTTYKQRSESSLRYLVDTLQLDWVNTHKGVQRTDLGSVQHLFSHIRKVYHAEWILIEDADGTSGANKQNKPGKDSPEIQWLTIQDLATAAIPTGINKTYQLLQKHKSSNDKNANGSSEGSKRKRAVKSESVAGDNKTTKEDHGGISRFFVKKSRQE